jgi:hypothetical protein
VIAVQVVDNQARPNAAKTYPQQVQAADNAYTRRVDDHKLRNIKCLRDLPPVLWLYKHHQILIYPSFQA